MAFRGTRVSKIVKKLDFGGVAGYRIQIVPTGHADTQKRFLSQALNNSPTEEDYSHGALEFDSKAKAPSKAPPAAAMRSKAFADAPPENKERDPIRPWVEHVPPSMMLIGAPEGHGTHAGAAILGFLGGISDLGIAFGAFGGNAADGGGDVCGD